MFRLLACVLVFSFTMVPSDAASQAPARDASGSKAGAARIRGRVVAGDSGQPLRRVQVRATSAGARDVHMASTDADGKYELKDLPAGRYRLSATKGGFVSLAYGQSRPFEAGKPLEIADRQIVDKVDFALPRGGVIAGRVTDEFGEPIVDVRVMAMRDSYARGRRQLNVSGRQVTTNDLGEYRIFDLAPGQYVVAAMQTAGTAETAALSADRSGYAPTYYPGTPDPSHAERLTLGVGQALPSIDVPLLPTRTSRVTGTAFDAEGKPLSGGLVMVLQRRGSTVMSTSGTPVRADGSFTVSNLAPGEYLLRAVNPGGPGDLSEMATGQVTVAGEDITGIHLTGTKATVATGRVLLPPASVAALPASRIQLMAVPAHPEDDVLPAFATARVDEDYAFQLKIRPGLALILADVPAGWTIKAVRHKGNDVTDTGIDFRRDGESSGIEIELTNQTTDVSGSVTGSRGEPVKDYTVVLFSTSRERWGYMSRFFRTARPDQAGRYRVEALPPGEYYAVAVDYVEAGEASDPEFLERVSAGATTFSLIEGETRILNLTRR